MADKWIRIKDDILRVRKIIKIRDTRYGEGWRLFVDFPKFQLVYDFKTEEEMAKVMHEITDGPIEE